MPSQRKKGLKLIGAFVPDATYKALKAAAKKRGLPMAELVRELIQKYLGK